MGLRPHIERKHKTKEEFYTCIEGNNRGKEKCIRKEQERGSCVHKMKERLEQRRNYLQVYLGKTRAKREL